MTGTAIYFDRICYYWKEEEVEDFLFRSNLKNQLLATTD